MRWFKVSLTLWNMSTSTRQIGTVFGADIHGSQTVPTTDFGDPLVFQLVTPLS